jgi:hypothetical protein
MLPTCLAVTAAHGIENVIIGTTSEILCVEINDTKVVVSSTRVPGGVVAIRPTNNAYQLMTGLGPRRFVINMTTNVADLSN